MGITLDATRQQSLGELLAHQIPGFSAANATARFSDLGVDSFGLVELRLGIENLVGRPLPDSVWLALRSPADLLAALGSLPGTTARAALPQTAARQRDFVLNMPHLGPSGLSESWLCKELGDTHWSMITDG